MNRKPIVTMLALATALSVGGCTTTTATGPGAEAKKPTVPTVGFTFAWPKDLSIKATVSSQQKVTTNGTTQSWTGKSSMDLAAQPRQPSGFVLEATNEKFDGDAKAPFKDIFERVATTTLPDITVSGAGDYEGATGGWDTLDAYSTAAGIDLSKVPAPQIAQVKALLAKVMSATASDLWNNMVGFWAGKHLPIAKEVSKTNLVPIPAAGGQVPTYLTYKLAGRVPCSGTGTATDCVELHLSSRLDSVKVKALLEQKLEAAEKMAAAEAAAKAKAEAAAAKAAGDATATPADATAKPADAKAEPADAKAKPADAKAKPADATAKPADGAAPTPADGTAKPADGAAATPAPPPAPKLAQPMMIGLEKEVHLELVTHPDTLVPVKLVKTLHVVVTRRMPDGTDQKQTQDQTTTYDFAQTAKAAK